MEEETKADDVLDALLVPLRAHLATLDLAVKEMDVERNKLLDQRAKVRKTLAFLDPEAAVKKKETKRQSGRSVEEHAAELQAFLEARNGALADGFTATEVYRLITANGAPLIGKEQVRKGMHELHDRGVIRLDRRGQGGSMIFKLVGQ